MSRFVILVFSFLQIAVPTHSFAPLPMADLAEYLDNLALQSKATREAAPPRSEREIPSMLITIGPQCSGKTTAMQGERGQEVFDVTIDDQEGVYVRVGKEGFIEPNFLGAAEARLASDESNIEQRLVLCRLLNNISR